MSTHLTAHGTTYYFRFFIPTDIQPILGRKVIKLSLRTGNRRLANRTSRRLASASREFISRLRGETMTELDRDELQSRLMAHLGEMLDEDERKRAHPSRYGLAHASMAVITDTIISDLRSDLATSQFDTIRPYAEEFIQRQNLDIDLDSTDFYRLAREVGKAVLRALPIILCRDHGDVEGELKLLDKLFPKATQSPTPAPAPTVASVQPTTPTGTKKHPLSILIPKYMKQTRISETSREKYNFVLLEFKGIVGDMDVEDIDHRTLRDYVDILSKLPPYYTTRFKGIAALDLAKREHEEHLTARTINDKIGVVDRFFNWAVNQGYMASNFAKGKKLPGGKPNFSTHEPYTHEDLQKMFTTKGYSDDSFKKSYQFWLPLLALHTGARQAELAQLAFEDVFNVDGIWCIRIQLNEDDINTSLKTENARRTIPLHKNIVDVLDFPSFVKAAQAAGHPRVFKDCKAYRGKYGKDVSAWFNNTFKPKVEITPPKQGFKKDFHSFRNTLINAVKQAGGDVRMAEETFGHADSTGQKQSMSFDYYGSPYELRIRYDEIICRVDFGIDFSHLKKSKFNDHQP